MANLHVQPKRRNNSWIWILVIVLIIAAAVYYYLNYYKKGITPGSEKAFREAPSQQLNLSQVRVKNVGKDIM
ncbi:MAG: hypothetical protein ABJA71_12140 [Ginsengibacter sp.]